MSIIAKYKFDGSVYADLIPEFNTEFTNYTVTDEVEGNIITRTIESDSLPTLMRFATVDSSSISTRELCLLEVIEVDFSNCTNLYHHFRRCSNLTNVHITGFNDGLKGMDNMFGYCSSLKYLDFRNCNAELSGLQFAFIGCSNLTTLDISNLKLSSSANTMDMLTDVAYIKYIKCNIPNTISAISSLLPTRTSDNPGTIIYQGTETLPSEVITELQTKGWNVVTSPQLIAKYKYDSTIYKNLIPEFNDGYMGFVEDEEVDENGVVTRKIEHVELPTQMRFGSNLDTYVEGSELALLEVLEMNTSGLTSCYRMFKYCKNLTSITCEWDTSNVTSISAMFYHCDSLTSLDVSNWDTSNVTNMKSMFYNCYSLTLLDVSNFNTSKVTDMSWMFAHCTNLTSLDISNFDTSKVTNMYQMFYNCKLLTSLDVSNWNTSNVTNMQQVFDMCCTLNVDVSNWNTSNVTSIYAMFGDCHAISSLDLTKWNTSKMTNMLGVFWGCNNLVELNISSWDTSKVTNMKRMFYECNKLTTLDISNFNTSKVTDTSDMFMNSSLLTDIGMIYCDQSTINKVASLLPSDTNRTIWVESDDILQYDQYDHITYKTQKVQDTVHLNSPLLMGDTIEVIDGKTYHVHRYEKVVLDGNGNFLRKYENIYNGKCLYIFEIDNVKEMGIILSDIFKMGTIYTDYGHSMSCIPLSDGIGFIIDSEKLENKYTIDAFRQWLQNNPTTVVYELASPYYELISDEPLELTLLDTTDNTINNNSILPSNMTIANKELSTIAIKPSTTYTLSFDKSNEDSEVTIDICGGEQITTVLNRVELTTPSELGSGIRFISSDGCIVSNVRLLEGSLVESAMPKETFEGLQSSFDDGYIIGENLVGEVYHKGNALVDNSRVCKVPISKTLELNTKYTFVVDVEFEKLTSPLHLVSGDEMAAKYLYQDIFNSGINICHITVTSSNVNYIYLYADPNTDNIYTIRNLIVLEGDHTHLSEAELMRYIEKGTSHYEEEDFNHVGKYKVEYKVTGKNKFDINKCSFNTFDNGYAYMQHEINNKILLKKGVTYTLSYDCIIENPINTIMNICFIRDNGLPPNTFYVSSTTGKKVCSFTPIKTREYEIIIIQNNGDTVGKYYVKPDSIQLEEGTVATEYEPYKEDIRTYYLSSPFLEGDTIEDINGVATHVKRYGKVVLDGSEDEIWNNYSGSDEYFNGFVDATNIKYDSSSNMICDTFVSAPFYGWYDMENVGVGGSPHIQFFISRDKLDTQDISGVRKWFSKNPTTVVYELASPIYESISTESILCDSYVNGHLDFDTNIPIEKVMFNANFLPIKYQTTSTSYKVQFESDNEGIITETFFGGNMNEVKYNISVNKGINNYLMSTGNGTIGNTLYLNGIGFNASNIQVVATDRDVDFGYFKGLQSSFENELVTDENDENYGKYKVDVKVTGKNKFDGVLPEKIDFWSSSCYIKRGTYRFSANLSGFNNGTRLVIAFADKDGEIITNTKIGYSTNLDRDCYMMRFYSNDHNYSQSLNNFVNISNFQLEEGTVATSYEPYKEYTKTVYLNSPLLEGDTIEEIDGKICHCHKMGSVILDGSEDEIWSIVSEASNDSITTYEARRHPFLAKMSTSNYFMCDKLKPSNNNTPTVSQMLINIENNNNYYWVTLSGKSTDVTLTKQWLQTNPTTVFYELAEPWYEPIEPEQSQLLLSSIKEGDLSVTSMIPISNMSISYTTCVPSATVIEEELEATRTIQDEQDAMILDNTVNIALMQLTM